MLSIDRPLVLAGSFKRLVEDVDFELEIVGRDEGLEDRLRNACDSS